MPPDGSGLGSKQRHDVKPSKLLTKVICKIKCLHCAL